MIDIVGIGLNEDRHLEFGETDGVGDAFFVSEVWQAHKDAVDAGALVAEELPAFDRVVPTLHVAKLGLAGSKPNGVDGEFGEELRQVATRFGDERVGEEVAIAENNAESDCMGHGSYLIFSKLPILIGVRLGDKVAWDDLPFGFSSTAGF